MPHTEPTSYAAQYQATKARNTHAKTALAAFEKTLTFPLDNFQTQACRSVETGRSVLVAAPTGAGKTVVGEFSIYLALREGNKAFYTTPIKALSNQKYRDLVREYGQETIGLLTGDTSINTEAPILVMTTEVLRNMLYANSTTLTGLQYVIMDEVHYLADKFRGAVWEEAIIHLPEHISIISLSATVSNVEEFGAWLETVRGNTDTIVSEHRPVPLWQHMLVGNRIIDLFTPENTTPNHHPTPPAPPGMQLNPQLTQLRPSPRRTPRPGRNKRHRRNQHKHTYTPHTNTENTLHPRRTTRPEMIQALNKAGLLPAICFIFSRTGCDDAITQCINANLTLTTPEEQQTIRAYIAQTTTHFNTQDLNTLGFHEWREGLTRGIAAHHAGMLPLFKETVENLFTQGLIKIVFATETLALGINMPARTVILEKLTKYNGENHVEITPGEYTQLTGRAGRRGIDIEGHALITWRHGLNPEQAAALASTRTYPLNSSFHPTYNMAANLIATYGAEPARKILESSFAQFQADKSVVNLASRVRKNEHALNGYQQAAQCHLGDITEYYSLTRTIKELTQKIQKTNQHLTRTQINSSIQELRPGDIIRIPIGTNRGYALVTTGTESQTNPQIGILTENAHLRTITPRNFNEPVTPISHLKFPKHPNVKTPKERRDTASRMRQALKNNQPPRHTTPHTLTRRPTTTETQLENLTKRLHNHPCHGCHDKENHLRWAKRWHKLNTETNALRHQINRRTNTLAKTFNRITHLLTDYGYITDHNNTPNLTPTGENLRKLYGEKDLLTSLCLDQGFLNNLTPAEIAATIAALTYEGKRDTLQHLTHPPTPNLRTPITTINRELARLNTAEEKHKLTPTPPCDYGLVEPTYRWAQGNNLTKTLENTTLAAGDFVRYTKQIIDTLDQITHLPNLPTTTRTNCQKAINLIRRGIIALDL